MASALTAAERMRLETLEETVTSLAKLVKGGGSTNQLNRLLVLSQDQNRKLTEQVEALETTMAEVIDKVRKLQ